MARRQPTQANVATGLLGFFALLFVLGAIDGNYILKLLLSMSVAVLAAFLLLERLGNSHSFTSTNWGADDSKYRYSASGGKPSYTFHQQTVDETAPAVWTLKLLQSMEWLVFEQLVASYFKMRGMKAELTGSGADGGVDVKVTTQTTQAKRQIYVQCKAWSKQMVGVKPVRELYGVMMADKADMGILITTSTFTEDSLRFAKNIPSLRLINGEQFLALMKKLPADQQQALLTQFIRGDYKTPSCPKCSIKMVSRRSQKRGFDAKPFWGCRNFPRCRQTMQMKRDQAA
ncbi:hypothetical protein GCM10023116_05790 [Kistimonas scapharcae]|uniref:Restriction endonuclease n=1 Tax=Kistimonas scapharcae TaxID=1036133 RepID=A0ABP8UXH6_9GAMM